MSQREFTVSDAYYSKNSGALRWIFAHLWHYKFILIGFLVLSLATNIFYATLASFIGLAFNVVAQAEAGRLLFIAVLVILAGVLAEITSVGAALSASLLGQRLTRDVRDELYRSLLGKSQTFHNRQRVGDLMARASGDVDQLNEMMVPGLYVTLQAFGGILVDMVFIATLNLQLIAVPLLYMAVLFLTLRPYQKQLMAVADPMREHYGDLSASLNETVTGIETVKATAQEQQEKQKFLAQALNYRNFFEKYGLVEGRYFPALILGVFLVLAFLHALYLLSLGQIGLGALITFMILIVDHLRYVTETSLGDVSLLQSGIAGGKRILEILREETELDENELGHQAIIHGDVTFDNVSFSYNDTPVLKQISFQARAGQTVALVGQIGAGKSTITKLINRIHDAEEGRVFVDGIDVREWRLTDLRSQIATIEQDIFLFSSTIAENIAYGLEQVTTDRAAIEAAAKAAQAHEFIMHLPRGYDTAVGDRGMTLSGGQRQRIAIARALLINPRILILDDATSSIDSATEDEIQKAIRYVQQGRTTFLITHRLLQVRSADLILVLQDGTIIDQGTHEELLERCSLYSRIFSHVAVTA